MLNNRRVAKGLGGAPCAPVEERHSLSVEPERCIGGAPAREIADPADARSLGMCVCMCVYVGVNAPGS